MDNLKKLLEDISVSKPDFSPVYCDYIAQLISIILKTKDDKKLLAQVSNVKYDLAPDGSLLTTNKYVYVADVNGSQYTITVENT